jgi:hypothetical protein
LLLLDAAEQILGPERRQRVSHQTWCGEGNVGARRPVNSDVMFFQEMAMEDSIKSPDTMVVGFAWYRPEQWQRVREISADADDLHDSYLEWLQSAEERFQELRSSSGIRVEKVDVYSEALILWCNERGLEINGEARSRYVAERLRKLDQNESLISRRT